MCVCVVAYSYVGYVYMFVMLFVNMCCWFVYGLICFICLYRLAGEPLCERNVERERGRWHSLTAFILYIIRIIM